MRAITTLFLLWTLPLVALTQSLSIPSANPVEQIKISGNIHLELVASDTMNILFETESIPENMIVEWTTGKLTLKTRSELTQSPAVSVKLNYTSLAGIEITRGAVVQSADTLKTPVLSLRVETGGKAELLIVTDSLSARVNQGADIILQGSTRSQSINAYTVGNYLGFELLAGLSWVKAATGAQVKINSTKFLKANATSKALVAYLGKPEIKEFKTSVGGKITSQSE